MALIFARSGVVVRVPAMDAPSFRLQPPLVPGMWLEVKFAAAHCSHVPRACLEKCELGPKGIISASKCDIC